MDKQSQGAWTIERRPTEMGWSYDVELDGQLVCSFPVNYPALDSVQYGWACRFIENAQGRVAA